MMALFSRLRHVMWMMMAALPTVLGQNEGVVRITSDERTQEGELFHSLPVAIRMWCPEWKCDYSVLIINDTNTSPVCIMVKQVQENKMQVWASGTNCHNFRREWKVTHHWPSTVEGIGPTLFMYVDKTKHLVVTMNKRERYMLKIPLSDNEEAESPSFKGNEPEIFFPSDECHSMSVVHVTENAMVEVMRIPHPKSPKAKKCITFNESSTDWWGFTIVSDDNIWLKAVGEDREISLLVSRLQMGGGLCEGTQYFSGIYKADNDSWVRANLTNTDNSLGNQVLVKVQDEPVIDLSTEDAKCRALYEMYHFYVKGAEVSINCEPHIKKLPQLKACMDLKENQIPFIIFFVFQLFLFAGYGWLFIGVVKQRSLIFHVRVSPEQEAHYEYPRPI